MGLRSGRQARQGVSAWGFPQRITRAANRRHNICHLRLASCLLFFSSASHRCIALQSASSNNGGPDPRHLSLCLEGAKKEQLRTHDNRQGDVRQPDTRLASWHNDHPQSILLEPCSTGTRSATFSTFASFFSTHQPQCALHCAVHWPSCLDQPRQVSLCSQVCVDRWERMGQGATPSSPALDPTTCQGQRP